MTTKRVTLTLEIRGPGTVWMSEIISWLQARQISAGGRIPSGADRVVLERHALRRRGEIAVSRNVHTSRLEYRTQYE